MSTTIPATFGSSGSLILNKKGELISVMSVAVIHFGNISAGCGVEEIADFFNTIPQ